MFELVRANRRKSFCLAAAMAALLLGLGYLIGEAVRPGGGALGAAVAAGLWLLQLLVGYYGGDSIALAICGAKEVRKEDAPQLCNVVEEMAIAAGLPQPPRVFLIPEEAPNAFATGRNPKTAAVAVTTGLLKRLNRDELQGVIAHELSHVRHLDILYMTVAGTMLGAAVLISEMFLRGTYYSSGRYGGRSRNQAQGAIMLLALVLAILAPLLAQLLYYAISRRREYLADAGGAILTRYPEGLASALEKIATSTIPLPVANKVNAPMFIINPLRREGLAASELTSTHPPISERIKILRGMAGGGYLDYQRSWQKVTGQFRPLLPPSARKEAAVAQRPPSASEKIDPKAQARQLGDLLGRLHGYAFFICPCGLKMKVPPTYARPEVACPRCGRVSPRPRPLDAAADPGKGP